MTAMIGFRILAVTLMSLCISLPGFSKSKQEPTPPAQQEKSMKKMKGHQQRKTASESGKKKGHNKKAKVAKKKGKGKDNKATKIKKPAKPSPAPAKELESPEEY